MKALNRAILGILLLARRLSASPALLPPEKFHASGVRKVLAISCTAIGDTLFATPSLRALSHLLPEAEIHFLVRTRFMDLFRTNPHVSRLLGYRGRCRGILGLLKEFKRQRYDLCLIFHDSDP